jgi:hypothetical protein
LAARKRASRGSKSTTEVRAWATNWDAGLKTVRTIVRWCGFASVVFLLSPFAGKQTIFNALVQLGGKATVEVAPLSLILPWVLVVLLVVVSGVLLFVVFGKKLLGHLGHQLVEFEQQDSSGKDAEPEDKNA